MVDEYPSLTTMPLGRAVVRISDAAYQVAALLDFDAEASARTSLLVRGGTCDGYVQKRSQ